jgi:hypothetical protein
LYPTRIFIDSTPVAGSAPAERSEFYRVRTLLRRSTGREVETSGPPAEICSCNFGIPAAMAEKLLLRFRCVGPSRRQPKNAPAFPASRPAMPKTALSFPMCRAIQVPAEICSCNFGIPAIHGGEKKGRVRGP